MAGEGARSVELVGVSTYLLVGCGKGILGSQRHCGVVELNLAIQEKMKGYFDEGRREKGRETR